MRIQLSILRVRIESFAGSLSRLHQLPKVPLELIGKEANQCELVEKLEKLFRKTLLN
jgi:hypothetical protein